MPPDVKKPLDLRYYKTDVKNEAFPNDRLQKNGTVVEELCLEITKDSKLSVMMAYLTICAFAKLKRDLMKVGRIRLLFTDLSRYSGKTGDIHLPSRSMWRMRSPLYRGAEERDSIQPKGGTKCED